VTITSNCWQDGVSNERYHSAEVCDGPSISASGLKAIALDCPAIYWAQSALNPKREPKETRALDFGKAAHALTLGEPTFDAEFVLSPFKDFRKDEAKKWRDEQTRTIITEDDLRVIRLMVAELKSTPHVGAAFTNGTPERSFFWKDKETGVWLKARPDWFPHAPASRYIVEYKSTVSVKPEKFGYQAFDLGYPIQAALMLDVVEAVTGEKPIGIAHAIQMKAPPFLADLQFFTADQIQWGRSLYRKALQTFAECWSRHTAGKPERVAWPGYRTTPEPIFTPFRVAKEIADEQTEIFNVTSTRNLAA